MLIDFETRLIYWTTRDPGGVLGADMDGSEIEGKILTPIATGLSIPIGITMDRETKGAQCCSCQIATRKAIGVHVLN